MTVADLEKYPDRPWLALYPEGLAPEIDAPEFDSLADFAVAAMARWGDRPAFDNMGTRLSFAEIDSLTRDLAAFYQHRLGLEPGDRIVIMMPNLLQFPVALFAALRAGLVVVNANPLYTSHEIDAVLAEATPRAIVVLENFADTIAEVVGSSSLENVIITGAGDLFPAPKRVAVSLALRARRQVPRYDLPNAVRFREALRLGAQMTLDHAPRELDDVAVLQFTGGTTGTPKAAMLTNRNLLSNQAQLRNPGSIPLNLGSERVLAALPMYHVFCLTVNCLTLFGMGALNILVTNPREIKSLVKTIGRTRPTVTMLVSTLAGALADTPSFRALDHSQVKLDIAGGMAVRRSVAQRWQEVTGHPLLEGYGLTEASPVVALNPVWGGERMGTIGIPLPSTEIAIMSDDHKPLPFGEEGEMALRGPQVMKGYWNRPKDTAQAVTPDGWLLTGDIAVLEPDGFITIVDRKKDIIVVGGFNVYPNEVEDALSHNPKIAEVGVVGAPNAHSGEVVKAFIVKRDPSLTTDEVRAYAREWLTGYKRPREIVFVDDLPKSNVGKVLRKKLREL